MGSKMDEYEAAYTVGKLSADIISAIDTLRECTGINKGKLKSAANQMMVQCNRESNAFFGNNPQATEVYSRDILLVKRVENLSPGERIAVDNFIDSLNKIRKE